MKKTLTVLLGVIVLAAFATGALAAKSTEDRLKDLEKQVRALETRNAKTKLMWTGDLRVEAHSITGEVNPYFDGMQLQYLMTGSMFMQGHPEFPASGLDPMDADDINTFIGMHGADYMAWSGALTFEDLKNNVEAMPPGALEGFVGALVPATYQDGYKTDNSLLYTTRLRLNMDAKVSKNVAFNGRLSMFKPWGASTQTSVFNGQANTLNTDANWPGTPGDATLKVDRAYFTWKKMFNQPLYLSLGRRPSTDGPPLHYRHDEARAGTPMGTIIDMQFDGATLGWNFGDKTTVRACYGLGYESQYGNGVMDKDQAQLMAQEDPTTLVDSDLDALRTEVEQRLAGATERLERLEARSGAVARVIAAAGRSTIFLQGSYGFEDPASWPPTTVSSSATGIWPFPGSMIPPPGL